MNTLYSPMHVSRFRFIISETLNNPEGQTEILVKCLHAMEWEKDRIIPKWTPMVDITNTFILPDLS